MCFNMIKPLATPLLAALRSPAGKGLTSWLSCVDVLLGFCHFSVWCPGSGVVFDLLTSDLCLLILILAKVYFRQAINLFRVHGFLPV